MAGWMALQIYCGVTGSKDIVCSGREMLYHVRTVLTELALWRQVCAYAKYKSVHGKFSWMWPIFSFLPPVEKNDILDTVTVNALLVHYGINSQGAIKA